MSLLRTLTTSGGRLATAIIVKPIRTNGIAAGLRRYGELEGNGCRRLIASASTTTTTTTNRRTFGSSGSSRNRLLRPKSDESERGDLEAAGSTSSPLITAASFDANSSRVLLTVESSSSPSSSAERFEFPAVWLRDNCQCSGCYHGGSSSRVLNWETFDVDRIRVADVRVIADGRSLEVLWQEGANHHRSVYELRWLMERSFREADTRAYLREWYRPEPVLWGAERFECGEVLQEFSYHEVLHDDGILRQWIEALIRSGVVMIKGAPLTEHECRRLAERVGFIRKTHYGEEFIVKAKEGTSNVAYLSTPLQMHTDLPYYDYKPGCNLLHCLVQSTNTVGGENLIADGFYVAERMRHEHPDDFRLLAETLVNWSDLGADEGGAFHSIYRAPVICIGRDGRLERINHSVPQRDSHFSVPLDRVERWYRAMQRFVAVLHREAVQFRTAPGDILTFSNVRMVHGRTGYTDTAGNTRHIVGAYLDWDEIYSRLRVLKAADEKTR